MATISEALAIAFAHHQRGELAQAERIYRRILDAEPAHADAWHLVGVAAHQAGRHAEAIEAISRAIAIDPANAAYHNHLGAAHASLDQFDDAERAFQTATRLAPADAQIHYNLAALRVLRDQPDEAIAGYREALRLNPQFAEAAFNLGNLLRDTGQLAEAQAAYEAALRAHPNYQKAATSLAALHQKQDHAEETEAALRRLLDINPQNVDALFRLGSLQQSQERLNEAAASLQAAVFHDPRHAEAQNNLGCIFRAQGQLDAAEQCLRLALVARPDFAEALNNLGSVLHEKKQDDAAADCYQRALALRPEFAEAHNNLGTIYQERKDYEQALRIITRRLRSIPARPRRWPISARSTSCKATCRRRSNTTACALELDPSQHQAHFHIAAAHHFEHRFDDALASYEEAIRLKPDYAEAYYNRSFVHLSRGDFAAGWPDYEWRFRCKEYKGRRFAQPVWDGAPLAGRTLLIHAEQGLGDTLHFIRYARLAERLGDKVCVEVQPALVPLLKASGFRGIFPGGSPLPQFDVHAALMSLPGIFGTTRETVPGRVPYLAADPKLAKTWRCRLRSVPGFKVGLIWQGNAAYTMDRFRSIPLVEFAPLADVPGVQLVSLQKHAGSEQVAALDGRFEVLDLSDSLDAETGAFMDTAAVMCSLDLIVTSDTAAAHLAGGWACPRGWPCRARPNGGGSTKAPKIPGTPRCGSSASPPKATGRAFSPP